MRESSTYQAILEEGAIEQAWKIIQILGRQKIGPPSDAVVAALKGITNLERLDRLIDRIFTVTVSSWDELMATP